MTLSIKFDFKHLLITMMLLLPQLAHCAHVTVGDLSYEINLSTHTASVYSLGLDWSGSMPTFKHIENLIIPETIVYDGQTYTVTAIENDAMRSTGSYLSGTLTLPNTLTTIGDHAFNGSDKLCGDLIIPNSVTYIGKGAFDSCVGFNGNLILSNSLKTIGDRAFYMCMFSGALVIPDQVTTIGERSFYFCKGLTKLDMGNSVTSVGWAAFDSCTGLTELILSNSLTAIEASAFEHCDGLNGNIVIPNSVTHIGYKAFYYCGNIKGLKLGENVSVIEDDAFHGCKEIASELVFPNSITTIGNYAFYGCKKLSGDLILPNSLTSIGQSAFYECHGLNGILKIPESITSIKSATFFDVNFKEVYLPNTMESITHSSIYSKNLKLVVCEALIPPIPCIEDSDDEQFDWIWLYQNYTAKLLVPAESIEQYKESPYWNKLASIEAIGIDIPATRIELDHISANIHIGESLELHSSIYPENTSDKSVTWKSSNNAIATVDANGKVTAVAVGKATITATAANGVSASCTVTVLPRETTPITVTRSEELMIIMDGETAEMSVNVTGGYPEGLTFEWNKCGTTVGTANSLKVIGRSNGDKKSNEFYSVRVVDVCDGVTLLDQTYQFEVETWPRPASNITIETDSDRDKMKIREGNLLELSASMPEGGYSSNWNFDWYLDDSKISNEPKMSHLMTMASGKEMATEEAMVTLTATNFGPDGTVWGNAVSAPVNVTVYRRPLTPKQLLHKGDGATHTLIVMSQYSDEELARLGYTFVYGYTDATGEDHIVATTCKRYCRIDEQVFRDAACEKWSYSQWTYADGSVVTSGKRYLDGRAVEDFDASNFPDDASPKKIVDFSDSNNWIRSNGKGINISIETTDEARVDVFTVSGTLIDTVIIPANTFLSVDYTTERLTPDFYIISITSAEQRMVKKIIIK